MLSTISQRVTLRDIMSHLMRGLVFGEVVSISPIRNQLLECLRDSAQQ